MHPWNLTLHDRACLGDGAVAYCLGRVEIGVGATVAQEAYLCSGTHNFESERLELETAGIQVGANAFVGLRAIVLPGIVIGSGCVIGAGSVVTRDTEDDWLYAGNPAAKIRSRGGPPK